MTLNKMAAIGAALALTVIAVVAVILTAVPNEESDPRMDAMRRAALQNLASVVSAHYEAQGSLPAQLADLVDGSSLQDLPKDPVSGLVYDYEPEADDSYALCATFDDASQEGEVAEFWMHGAGRSCFRLSPAYGEF